MSDDPNKAPSTPVNEPVTSTWYDTFRRGRDRTWRTITEIGKAGWIITLIVLLMSSLSLFYNISGYNILSRDEDLRVTIRGGTQTPNRISLTLHFINLGKLSASIERIGLIEIDTTYVGDHVESNLASCDNINYGTRLALANPVVRFMGPGARVGSDKQGAGYFDASKRVVDGVDITDLNTPIFVDTTKEKVVTAEFEIGGFDSKKFNTMVICPVFDMLDESGKTQLSVCRGYVINVTGTLLHQYEVHPLWRLLPHGAGTQCME